MNRANRATQFQPFDALKGLREALEKKEYEHEKSQRRGLSEEEAANIQSTLLKLRKGDDIQVTYFVDGYYVTIEDKVSRIDLIFKYLIIGEGRIMFDNIYDIKMS